jgi:hypothetical protein
MIRDSPTGSKRAAGPNLWLSESFGVLFNDIWRNLTGMQELSGLSEEARIVRSLDFAPA